MARKHLQNGHRKYLTESQYKACMNALGYIYDEEFGRFFMGEYVFLGNVSDDVTEVVDLMKINENGHLTYASKLLNDFMNRGAALIIGEGAVDISGKKFKKALYCSNYRDLYSRKNKVKIK